MSRKQAIHLISTNSFGIQDKIKNFRKPRVTKARKDIKVRG